MINRKIFCKSGLRTSELNLSATCTRARTVTISVALSTGVRPAVIVKWFKQCTLSLQWWSCCLHCTQSCALNVQLIIYTCRHQRASSKYQKLRSRPLRSPRIGNESMPKIIINDTITFFLKTAISILLISNHNSFWVLFDKLASIYFIWKIYLYFSIGNGQPSEPTLCQLYRHTFVPRGKPWVPLIF